MAGFTVKQGRFPKVTGYVEGLTPTGAGERVSAILKVKSKGYVPDSVTLRERIDETLFTADIELAVLENLEADDEVSSVAISRNLKLVE